MQRSRCETRRVFIELPRIGEARLIRRAIVIHPLTPRRPTFREIAIPLSSLTLLPPPLFVRFCPGEFQKRYFMRSLFNPRPFVIAFRYRRDFVRPLSRNDDGSSGDWIRFARARSQGFTLMCLQWLLRFVARYNGARIRVTYSRDNWRNWWIMVPRHAGYFEAMFRVCEQTTNSIPYSSCSREDYASTIIQ